MNEESRITNEAMEYAVDKSGQFAERMADTGYTYDVSRWPRELYAAYIEEIAFAFIGRYKEIEEAMDVDPPFFK